MEQVQKSFRCRDGMHLCEKSWKQGNPLSNTDIIYTCTSTIVRNPSLHNSGKGLRMIVLVSLIVLLRGFPCFHDFSHNAFHPYSSILNDFWNCIIIIITTILPSPESAALPELAPCPWPALTHLSQTPAVKYL